MKIKTIVFFAAIVGALLFLSGCGEPYVPLVFRAEYTLRDLDITHRASADAEAVPMRLKIEVPNHELARHEPAEGTFFGAYIVRDRAIRGVRDFEARTGANHAIFAYTMTLGEDYPLRWVLENMAAGKAPFIMLTAWEDLCFGEQSRLLFENLRDFAVEAGRFNVPIFVNLFPLEGDHGFSPGEYISFFRAARGVFEFYAPNVALVWGFDAENMADSVIFYPGRDAMDWIHLTVYNDINGGGDFRDFFAYLDFFYLLYQQERPLAVSTGISHYSAQSNAYFTLQAAERITYVFERLQDYPRIKAILYRNYDDPAGSGNKFGVHDIEVIARAYEQAAANPRFIGFVDNLQGQRRANQIMRSPFNAMMVGAYFYIPLRALVYDARLPDAYLERLRGSEREINGEVFFSMIDINRVTGADVFVDFGRRMLRLR